MNSRSRLWTLLALCAGFLGITLLASGLNRLQVATLPPDDPRLYGELAAFIEQLASPRTLLILLACSAPFLIITLYLVLTSQSRQRERQGRRNLILEILLWTIAFALIRFSLEESGAFRNLGRGEGDPGDALLPYPPVPFSGSPSTLASAAAAFLLLALLAVLVYAMWRRRRPAFVPSERIGQEAAAALDELRSGADFRNVILRCYADMCRVIDEHQGLHRQEAMTPREFEASLLAAGLPSGPVERLTRLFETVRYGARQPRPEEEAIAISCLTDIAAAARGSV